MPTTFASPMATFVQFLGFRVKAGFTLNRKDTYYEVFIESRWKSCFDGKKLRLFLQLFLEYIGRSDNVSSLIFTGLLDTELKLGISKSRLSSPFAKITSFFLGNNLRHIVSNKKSEVFYYYVIKLWRLSGLRLCILWPIRKRNV